MAQQVKVILVDDIDGGTADETVRFSVDGTDYEMDLSEKNARNFREALQPFTAKARRIAARGTRGRPAATPRSQEAAKVREWARANGYSVSERGRVQSEIIEAYRRSVGA